MGSASDEQVLAAIAVANAEDVLDSLPEGLDGHMEERGRSLSGGQRQRLVLARALLAEAEILILVEPTSAVDAHTEARIAQRLHEARRGRTTVVMTGSPLVLDQADRVVLIADGRVAATGTHRELLRSSAAYTVRRHAGGRRMNERLPIAAGPEVRRDAAVLLRRYRRGLAVVLGLNALAALAGLVGPFLLGLLVQAVDDGTTAAYVDRVIAVLVVSVIAQTTLTWFARRSSFVLSEQVFAQLREDFMRQVLALPLSVVERAGTGDLVSRTTADVDTLARTVRFAIPETLISAVTVVLTVVAAFLVSPIAALSCVVGLPAIVIGTRWYLRRAPEGYLWERAAYATMTGTVGETVDGGRTVDALGLGRRRVDRVDADLAHAWGEGEAVLPGARRLCVTDGRGPRRACCPSRWRRATCSTRSLSRAGRRWWRVTTVALYVQQLADSVDRLISWLDEIQVGATWFALLRRRDEGSRRPRRDRRGAGA